ncbi:MAG: ABC transporter ATP-binding protein [Clostridia bacterium]
MHEQNEDYKKNFDLALWKKISRYVLKYWKLVAALTGVMVTLAVTDALMPLLTRHAIDTYIAEADTKGMLAFTLLYFVLLVIKASTIFFLIYIAERLMLNVGHDIRTAGFKKLQELSFSYYDKNTVGNLIARLTSDTHRLTGILSWGLVDLIWSISLLTFITVIMVTLNLSIALTVLTVIPLLVLVSMFFEKKILKSSREVRKNNSIITSAFNEGINGAITSKTLVRENRNLEEFTDKARALKTSAVKVAVYSALFFPIVSTLGMVGTSLAIWRGGLLVFSQVITFGTLAAFISYTLQFFMPINDLARIFADFQSAQAAGERIMTLLETEAEIKDSPEVLLHHGEVKPSHPVPRLQGDITFEDVSFQYKEGEKVLENFTLEVKAGECIAIVGETGSGKTTIVNLACRFYEPTGGRILIDGKDYRDIPLMHVQGNLGYMLQTPHLFSGTIKDNIKYGKLDAKDDEVEEAARLAGAHDFILSFKDGYEHKVSQGGGGLSTGQKQLICIARAIIADPSIFILDEATSSVDTHAERLIQHAINTIIRGRTSFVIAHRLSTIKSADRILVIEKGRMIEEGSHHDLILKKGHYYNLYRGQFMEERESILLGGAS